MTSRRSVRSNIKTNMNIKCEPSYKKDIVSPKSQYNVKIENMDAANEDKLKVRFILRISSKTVIFSRY